MATVNVRVAASADDCFVYLYPETFWIIGLTTTELYTGDLGGTNLKQGNGMRFLGAGLPGNVILPPSAKVLTATLTFTAKYSSSTTTVNSVIIGEKSATPATFSNIANYQGRRGTICGGANDNNITTAHAHWDNIGAITAEATFVSPDISTILQELVDAYNGITNCVLFWDDHAGASTAATRNGYAWDGDPAKAPLLSGTYSVSGNGGAVSKLLAGGIL